MKRLLAVLALLACTSAHASDFTDHVKITEPPVTMPPMVFVDEEGIQHTLAEYHGRFVLLNIWASWCAPCVKEMPALDQLQMKTNLKHLAVLPLSEDRDPDTVMAFYGSHGIHHLPVAVDRTGLAPSVLNLSGIPTTILINPQGIEVARVQGDADWASIEAGEFINEMSRL